jgi:hypothetical protein
MSGKPRASQHSVEDHATFSREYWRLGDVTCALGSLDGNLVVILTDGSRMIGLQACGDSFEAFAVASLWRANRPRWWPTDSDLL